MPSTWQTPQMAAYYGRQGGLAAAQAKRAIVYVDGTGYTYRTLGTALECSADAARIRVRRLRASGREITIAALEQFSHKDTP